MMGWTPAQVRRCTLAEFHAAFAGFRRFHGGADAEEADAPSLAEYKAALAQSLIATRH